MIVGKAIYNILSNNAAVSEFVGTRIYPEMAPEEAETPFLVYSVSSIEPADTKNATSEVDTYQLETYCVGDNYADLMDVGDAVRTALDRNGGNFNGVAIQSIQYLSAETEFNSVRRVYISQSRYNVRQLRTGTTPNVTLVGPNPITVGDGASVSGLVDTINFSPTSVSVSDNTAVVTITQIGQKTEVRQCFIESQFLTGGASEINLNAASPVTIPFGNRTIQIGDRIIESGSSGSGINAVLDAGLYEVICTVTVKSAGAGIGPRIQLHLEGSQIAPIATAYIDGGNDITQDTVTITTIVEANANDRITAVGWNGSTVNSAINIDSGMLSIRRLD